MLEDQETELTFLCRNIENTSTSRKIYTEQLLSAVSKSQTSEKPRKSPYNQVGQKEKEREGNRKGSVPWEVSCEGGKVSTPCEGSSPEDKLDWVEGKFWSIKRGDRRPVCGKQNRE